MNDFIRLRKNGNDVKVTVPWHPEFECGSLIEGLSEVAEENGVSFDFPEISYVTVGNIRDTRKEDISEPVDLMHERRSREKTKEWRMAYKEQYQTSKERLDDLWEKHKLRFMNKKPDASDEELEAEMKNWYGEKDEFEFMWLLHNPSDMSIDEKRQVEAMALSRLREVNTQYHLHMETEPTPQRVIAMESAMVGYKLGFGACGRLVMEQLDAQQARAQKELDDEERKLKKLEVDNGKLKKELTKETVLLQEEANLLQEEAKERRRLKEFEEEYRGLKKESKEMALLRAKERRIKSPTTITFNPRQLTRFEKIKRWFRIGPWGMFKHGRK